MNKNKCTKHEWVSLADSGLKLVHPLSDVSQVPKEEYPDITQYRVCKHCKQQEVWFNEEWMEYSGCIPQQLGEDGENRGDNK